ncbi:hypothetical protein SUGI_0205720 [Cryptomeria japonica]|uniref:glutamate receptor 3.4-like n=1 Tax=Cryptomeria japonica TaxID=3369 RepID=UPI002408D2BF|nr:glutamate receptor 3.4-like [Cryptomeria japonica]GLJ13123.1 hypothetical protein SUGI_0205720 [Cryptomeria japonica]
MQIAKKIELQLSIICVLVVVNSYPFNDTVNLKEIPDCNCGKGEEVESVAIFTPDELIKCCEWEWLRIQENISAGRNVSAQLRARALTNTSFYKKTKESELLYDYLSGVNYNYRNVDMVIPKRRQEASMWTFVKPFTAGMWCTIGGVMIYTALVVWLLEQKLNPLYYTEMSIMEVFTLIWSALSTMSLSQNVRIESRLARIVIAVWLLVMSVTVGSYMANLSSRLNAQKPNPTITITNLHEMLVGNVAVGYLKYTFIQWYLGIDLGSLKAYTTRKECAQALSKGSNNGGVAAVLMDPLDARRFVSERRGYTIYHIISLADSLPAADEMPKSLGVKDFLGLFVITAMVTTLGVITFFFKLLYSVGAVTDPNATGRGTDLLEMLPLNDDPEEQSSGQTMGITNISDQELENTLIETPHIAHESQSMSSVKSFLLLFIITGMVSRLSLIIFFQNLLHRTRKRSKH